MYNIYKYYSKPVAFNWYGEIILHALFINNGFIAYHKCGLTIFNSAMNKTKIINFTYIHVDYYYILLL